MNPLYDRLSACTLCPRNCRVNRWLGKEGFCRLSNQMVVDCALPHLGEEPPISGSKGSGTIFFSSCNLRCNFCQNYQISHTVIGRKMSTAALADTMLDLTRDGCHNINLVTPTPHAPFILEAIHQARRQGLTVPIVYNTSGYENPEVLRALAGLIDIYMPDFKFGDEQVAGSLAGVNNYVTYAREALKEMIRQVGERLEIKDGIAVRGLIVRHLVLPGMVENSLKVLDILAKEASNCLHLSIMSQYTPIPGIRHHPELGRRLTKIEYETVLDYALDIGFENIYIQKLDTRHLMPDFKREKPFCWYEEEDS